MDVTELLKQGAERENQSFVNPFVARNKAKRTVHIGNMTARGIYRNTDHAEKERGKKAAKFDE